MTDEQDKQAVAEQADDQAVPDTEDTGAQSDDLETLLAEYDDSTNQDDSTPGQQENGADKSQGADNETLKRLETLEAQHRQSEIQNLVGKVRGDVPENVFDDGEIEGWLEAKARKDPRIQRAWQDRYNKPQALEKIASELGKQLNEKFKNLPDKSASEDREAVANAVRGASTRAPEDGPAPDYSNASDSDFREDVRKKYGFTPHV